MFKIKIILSFFIIVFSLHAFANTSKGKYFDRAIFVIFENTNYDAALKQPFFAKLAKNGANFTNFLALTHPSQPNYIALTSGSFGGVRDDKPATINVSNIIDLLESKKISWKVYAEEYPGSCFLGAKAKTYARKHNPFISYLNIQKSPLRCAKIVNADQFDKDAMSGELPEYVFYIPNNRNDGHDTGVKYANEWYEKKFSKYISNKKFMENTVIVSTFDESGASRKNQIYTSIFGPDVQPGNYSKEVNLYSLLALIEENWNLGNLNKQDDSTERLPNIWR